MFKKFTFLHVLVIVLAIGLVMRLGDMMGIAVADDEQRPKAGEINISEGDGAQIVDLNGEDAPPEEGSLEEFSNANITVLRQLGDRRRAMDVRERELERREALLEAAQKELQLKFDELTALRNEIKQLLDQQSDEEEAQLLSLVKVYEGMKPQEAAEILNTLDLEILLQVMGRMSERRLSPILARMNPERAREVTINLATQKKLPEAPEAP